MSWLAPVTHSQPSQSQSQSQSQAQPDLTQSRRIHQIVRLKPEHYEEYKKCHADVWPEVKEQIQRSGIRDCKLRLFPFSWEEEMGF